MNKSRLVFWILFILFAASGGLLGYFFAVGEPTVYNEAYLESKVLEAANTNVTLAEDAAIDIVYTYKMCGHKEKVSVTQDNRFCGKTANEIRKAFSNINIRDFGEHYAQLEIEINEYCPDHYIVKITEGKVCIFKTDRNTGKSEMYLDLQMDASVVKADEVERLTDGVVFEDTDDVNDYLYSLKN